MDQLHLTYSLKNIPIPSRFQYKKLLVSKLESFLKRLRWKTHHILNPSSRNKQTFGFKTTNSPPQIDLLKPFEDDLLSMVSDIKFKVHNNQFQQQMKADKSEILKTKDVIVKGDKSANLYKLPVNDYKKYVLENITRDYRKCERKDVDKVTKEAAKIARNYDLDDRIDTPTEDEAFITIKDHKSSFPGRVECRLINPAKNHVGTISKCILDEKNRSIRMKTRSNQWQSTNAAIEWFKEIPFKSKKTFFKFDIVSFYPSITEKLLKDTISWARTIIPFSKEEESIILHCRKMFLFFEGDCWVKKSNQNFDVSMGSLDSAEISELVGLYLLSLLEDLIPKDQMGLYRDDGLAVVEMPGPEVERLRKKVIKLFSNQNLKITTDANIKVTDFLDVVFNLDTDSYKPFRKDNNLPSYINCSSNHPKHVIDELPNMISQRISTLSSNRQTFNNEATTYNQALKNSGYKDEIQFITRPPVTKRKQKRRKRNIIWFNPPWNVEVSTNIARKFLVMIDKHFPKGSEMGKHFNRNTIKVSYCTMPNMQSIISSHNRKMISPPDRPVTRSCNCRSRDNCVMAGQCLTTNIVYKSRVTTADDFKEYIGLTSNTFKERYNNHKSSFKNTNKAHSTSLSSYIWELKNNNTPFTSDWSIMGHAKAYSSKVRNCQLCLMEKTFIMLSDPKQTLNKRNEIVSKCRHRDKVLLKHW